jgi:predicted RNase H-like HicB family nuclease
MRHYFGLIHKDAGSDFGLAFPDFPGVITADATLEGARMLAEAALAFHVAGLIEDGEAIPDPAPLERVMAEADRRGLTAVIKVPLRTR